MKKLLIGILAAVALFALPVQAVHYSEQFLAPQISALVLGTNSYAVTNLATIQWTYANQSGASVAPTNQANILYYTQDGVLRKTGTNVAGNVSYDNFSFFRDIPLRQSGAPVTYPVGSTNVFDQAGTNLANVVINIKITGASAANSAVTFYFIPLYDGVTEPTGTAQLIPVAVTAASGAVVTATPIPAGSLIGAKALRLKYVINADGDWSGGVTVNSVTANYFAP